MRDDPARAPLLPSHVDLAVQSSTYSPCRSKRGCVIFRGENVVTWGYNFKPRGFDCDGSLTCKATCRAEAIHAEQMALLVAGVSSVGAEMIHVKTVDGQLVPSGGPSCPQCSKLALAAGIEAMWLYHEDGWRRYKTADWHRLSLEYVAGEAARDPVPRPPTSGVVVTDNRGTTFTEVRPGCFETPNGWCVNVTTSAGDPGLRVSLQQLIAKWRLAAKQDAVYGSAQALKSSREYFGTVNAAFALADCADELEALLARVPSPQAIERDLISDLVDVCYTDGTSREWRLCLGCEMEHHREAHAYDVCHARPDCVVAVAEKWLREQLAKARVPSRPASPREE